MASVATRSLKSRGTLPMFQWKPHPLGRRPKPTDVGTGAGSAAVLRKQSGAAPLVGFGSGVPQSSRERQCRREQRRDDGREGLRRPVGQPTAQLRLTEAVGGWRVGVGVRHEARGVSASWHR